MNKKKKKKKKKKEKQERVWGCKYQLLGEFCSSCVYRIHKRFTAKELHGRPTRSPLPKEISVSKFLTFTADHVYAFVIYIYIYI
jgi:hypothetical protein